MKYNLVLVFSWPRVLRCNCDINNWTRRSTRHRAEVLEKHSQEDAACRPLCTLALLSPRQIISFNESACYRNRYFRILFFFYRSWWLELRKLLSERKELRSTIFWAWSETVLRFWLRWRRRWVCKASKKALVKREYLFKILFSSFTGDSMNKTPLKFCCPRACDGLSCSWWAESAALAAFAHSRFPTLKYAI